jgi:hypothetical protein
MNEEILRVLKMVSEGKVKPEEGARLIESIQSSSIQEKGSTNKPGLEPEYMTWLKKPIDWLRGQNIWVQALFLMTLPGLLVLPPVWLFLLILLLLAGGALLIAKGATKQNTDRSLLTIGTVLICLGTIVGFSCFMIAQVKSGANMTTKILERPSQK